ncbi:MAG: restriction endonuclease subunit S [Brasilonema octagenarum HA4186-MV1]|jgi:type I restriction enzyme S subunit|nr:restriction endonuclease subunit S [Brasilonema octagenarum HA4186-MV1]
MKIGDLCEVVRGSSPRPKSDPRYYGGTVPRLMVADLTRDGKIVSARIDSLTELGAKQSRLMQQGDMVIAVSGAPGLPAILAHQACIHDGFVGLRNLDLMRICPNFLYSYLRFIRTTSNSQAVGAIFKNLTTDQIKGIDIPELPLKEQKRIAEVLDRAQSLISKRREAIAQLDTLTQAIFLEMFGDPTTNPKGWEKGKPLGDIAEIVSGITKGRKLNGQKVREIPYLAVVNVQDRMLDLTVLKFIEATENEILRYKLQVNDLLLTEGGDPDKLGRGTLWNGELPECIHQNHIFRVRITLNSLDPLFLNWLISSDYGKKYFLKQAKQTTGIATINMTQLRGFPLLIPPLTLQQEFARRVEAVEKLKTAHCASLSELDALFASLQHRAFRGEL